MIANTGTYIDSPFHRYESGKDLAELPLESVADLDCLVVRVAAGTTTIDDVPLSAANVKGRAVLFHTNWDRHFRTDAYFDDHPHLTARAAEWLVKVAERTPAPHRSYPPHSPSCPAGTPSPAQTSARPRPDTACSAAPR